MTKRVAGAVLVVAVVLGSAPADGQINVTTVALKKDYSPDPNFWYMRFWRPAAGDAASGPPVCYLVRVRGVTGGAKGIFMDGPDRASEGERIALTGDFSQDGGQFRKLGHPTMNADGNVAFDARLKGGGGGVFRGDRSVVALQGDGVPGVTGLLNGFSQACIVDGGDVLFRGTISDAADVGGVRVDQGVFRCRGGDGNCSSGTGLVEPLVLKNDPLPDRAEREICVINDVAASTFGIAFVAGTKEDCADGGEPRRRGVFRMPFGGEIVTLALEGEPSEPDPTEPDGTAYGLIWTAIDVSNDGTVVFRARTTGSLLNTILYLCEVATCPAAPAEAAVQVGTTDPRGNVFRRLGLPAVGDGGDMAFKATARGDDGTVTGVYLRRSGGVLETVALQGDIIPNLQPLTEYSRTLTRASRLDMSPGGRIVFKAKVRRAVPPRYSLEGVFLAE